MTISKNGKQVGGARPGSGRKPGTTNKVTALMIMDEMYAQTGMHFEEVLISELIKAQNSGDARLVKEYLQFISNKVIADKLETDITSNGQTIAPPVINIIKGPATL